MEEYVIASKTREYLGLAGLVSLGAIGIIAGYLCREIMKRERKMGAIRRHVDNLSPEKLYGRVLRNIKEGGLSEVLRKEGRRILGLKK